MNKVYSVKNLNILTAVLMAFGISTAYAAGAIVQIDVGGCSLLDGNGTQITGTTDYKSKLKVSTQSANGNLILSCRLNNVPNDTGRAVHYGLEDGNCFITDPRDGSVRKADVWNSIISTSGEALLSCQTNTPL